MLTAKAATTARIKAPELFAIGSFSPLLPHYDKQWTTKKQTANEMRLLSVSSFHTDSSCECKLDLLPFTCAMTKTSCPKYKEKKKTSLTKLLFSMTMTSRIPEKLYLCKNLSYMKTASKNIFAGQSSETAFVHIIYMELMKRHFVANIDVLCLYFGRDKNYYALHSLSGDKIYNQLKKAYLDVRNALETVCPGCIEDNGKNGKGRAYRYIGEADDPLAEERRAVVQKTVEDYVGFCKASAGILPASWFSSYFENTQLLLETNKEAESGAIYISSSLEQNLTNIELLPVFYKAITCRQVLQFSYQPFGMESFGLIFHPQFLKEYNGRWFVFGNANREPYRAYNVPLDRIVGRVSVVEDVEYVPAEKGFYQQFFNNIIGVTHENGAKVEKVVIRTKSEYQHGLLLTKPLHHSQKETLPFDEHGGLSYGEITLTIEPNRELRGKILLYGENLEVMEPFSLREQIRDIIKRQMAQYAGEE